MEQATLDNAVNTVTADNLDLGCRMIEKAAHDKAVRDIDDRLAPGYTVGAASKRAAAVVTCFKRPLACKAQGRSGRSACVWVNGDVSESTMQHRSGQQGTEATVVILAGSPEREGLRADVL